MRRGKVGIEAREGLKGATTAGIELTRRQFVVRMAAAGTSLPLATALPAFSSATESPRRGGVLRVALATSSVNDTLDPSRARGHADYSRTMNIFSRLVHIRPDLEIEGELAESWEASPGADEWIFRLRQGVEFHDGRSFTAEDVRYTLQRILDPETGSPARAVLSDVDLKESRADGDHVVRIKLTRPNATFVNILGDRHAQIYPAGSKEFEKPVGTGPFRLKSFEPGISAVVERNPNYWKSDLPYVDAIETVGIPDSVARINALLAGEVDLIESLSFPLIERIERAKGTQIIAAKSSFHVHFAMQANQPPFDDQNVRNALKHLVRRDEYLQTVYKGYGQIGNDHPFSPVDPLYCDDIPQRDYDPDRARTLLRTAGYDGLAIELFTSEALPGMVEGALTFREMAAAAGVQVQVTRQPTDGYWKSVWMQKPFVMAGWNMRPAPDMLLATAYASDANWNDTSWKRPEFDELLKQARSTLEPTKRRELFCAMQRMIHEDGGVIIPAFIDLIDAGSDKVRGLNPHPLGILGQFRWENVWLAA